MFKKNIDRLGWGIVSVVLFVDGIRHAVTGQLWGRVRLANSTPVSEGWTIVALGIAEMMFGLYLAWRLLKQKEG